MRILIIIKKKSWLKNNLASKDTLLELQREIGAKDNEIKTLKAFSVDEEALNSLKIELKSKESRINELQEVQKSFEEVKSSFEDKLNDKNKKIEELGQI